MRRAMRPNNLFTVFGGIMSSDNQLQQAVLAELKWEPSVTAAHIGVAANAGVVTLSGHVGSFAEKLAAEATARRVKGVKALAEEIEVRLPFATKKTDEEIAAAALGRLAWDVSVPNDAVKVKVEKGRITLTGQVDWQYQRQAAEHDVRGLYGVVGTSNQIKINPKVNTSNISDDIMHALHRSWFFDPKTINVSADEGEVRLSGTVRSWHERQVAAATAWAAPGVTDVVNDIVII
jgi:osmotically-inducible protein OsmY